MTKQEKTKTEFFSLLKIPGAVLFWTALWFVLSVAVRSELLLPSPAAVIKALGSLLKTPAFYTSCLKTLLRVLSAWAIGLTAGTLAAVLTSVSGIAKTLLTPALSVIKATPVASFIILALVMMRSSFVPVFSSALIVIPVAWANVTQGIASPDEKILEMARVFRMKKSAQLKYIRIPAVLPYLSAAASASMGLAWKACVAAEVIAVPSSSIGAGIQNAKVYLETPELFAWTLTVIVMSVALEKLLGLIFRKGGKNG